MAKVVGYWTDLKEMPEDGPFIVCGGPVGASVPRVEHARGPSGIGCPVTFDFRMYKYIEENDLPNRGHECADKLNALYHSGEFEWEGNNLVPKEQT